MIRFVQFLLGEITLKGFIYYENRFNSFPFGRGYFAGGPPAKNTLFAGTPPTYMKLFARGPPANIKGDV